MCIQKQHTLTVDDGEKRLDILDPSGNLILTCITLEVPFGGSGGTLEERSILIYHLCFLLEIHVTQYGTLRNYEYPLLVPTKRFLIRSILLSDNSPWL